MKDPRIAQEIIRAYRFVSIPNVSDAMDRLEHRRPPARTAADVDRLPAAGRHRGDDEAGHHRRVEGVAGHRHAARDHGRAPRRRAGDRLRQQPDREHHGRRGRRHRRPVRPDRMRGRRPGPRHRRIQDARPAGVRARSDPDVDPQPVRLRGPRHRRAARRRQGARRRPDRRRRERRAGDSQRGHSRRAGARPEAEGDRRQRDRGGAPRRGSGRGAREGSLRLR